MHHNRLRNKLLFITWDGPQTAYIEGLFMPIFEKVAALTNVEFHILQFTWATKERVEKIKAIAEQMGLNYSSYAITRNPHPAIGSIITLLKGRYVIDRYVKKHGINIVMPRSTFPAIMVNLIGRKNFSLIFDADGLPLEERVDFGSLTTTSSQYRLLKEQETQILKSANHVITRSQKAIDIHISRIGEDYRHKFSVVFNGRDENVFKPNVASRTKRRQDLGFLPTEKVFLYCGSLGKQYGWDEMLKIFESYARTKPAHWLILTGDVAYATGRIPQRLKDKITVITSPVTQVPNYLNVADIAFAIRQPSFSMQGVAPIKLGEYLLMGLPTIASAGIGDTGDILKEIPSCFIYDHTVGKDNFREIASWLNQAQADRQTIRMQALPYFSLQAAAASYINALNKL